MAIGFFRHKITLVGISSGPDGYGGRYEDFQSNLLDVFANVKQRSANRTEQVSQTMFEKFYEFQIRYYSTIDLTKAVYVMYEGDVFTIQSVEKVNERTHYWLITATKGE